MRDNEFFSFKFLNKYYVFRKEKQLKKLDIKAEELRKAIESEETKINYNAELLNRLEKENLLIKKEYNNLKAMLISRGCVLDIENKNYEIKEWDNLHLNKIGKKYSIVSKKGEEINNLNYEVSCIIDDMLSEGYVAGIIVIRLTVKNIRVQLRFIKKDE